MLYSGFFGDNDRSTMAIIRQTLPQNLPALDLKFDDPRMRQLFSVTGRETIQPP